MKNNLVSNSEFRTRNSVSAFCPVCGKVVELMTFPAAAAAFNTDLQDIEFLAGNHSLHRVHNYWGEIMVCSNSLFNCFDNRKTRLLSSHFAEKPTLAQSQFTEDGYLWP